MKIVFNEEKKLPLTFKYIEVFGNRNADHSKKERRYIKCEKFKTEFYEQMLPVKALVRML